MAKTILNLKQYLEVKEEGQQAFADRAHIPQSAVARLVKGEGSVGGIYWSRIMAATDNMVRPTTQHPEEFERVRES